MSLIGNLMHDDSSYTYGLTAKGKRRVEQTSSRSPEGQILCALEDNPDSTVREIANSTNIDTKIVKKKIKKMKRVGLIQAKSEDSD